jgi:guanylate kinase
MISKIREDFPNQFSFSVSHTTRPFRQGEVDGKNYFFTTRENFEEMLKKDEFIEHTQYNNNYYGTSKGELERTRSDVMVFK